MSSTDNNNVEKPNEENKEDKKEENQASNKDDDEVDNKIADLLEQMKSLMSEGEEKGKELTEEEKKEIKEKKYKTVIEKLKTNSFKKIVFMTGAGISTSAGIPDFRSKNGLFQQLQKKYNLNRPEEFFDIQRFLTNPEYFYEFTKNFQKENYQPTPFHYFMGFLDRKGLLSYVFTQNIDGLELSSGIDKNKLIFAHGNFIEAHCPKCKTNVDTEEFNKHVQMDKILYCEKCNAPCKSKVVFYGECLPKLFFEKLDDIKLADLVIICGTSLLVSPFNMLPYDYVSRDCWRVVINKEPVGNTWGKTGFKYESDSLDLLMEGYSDETIQKIVKECGWEKEFQDFIEEIKKNNKK